MVKVAVEGRSVALPNSSLTLRVPIMLAAGKDTLPDGFASTEKVINCPAQAVLVEIVHCFLTFDFGVAPLKPVP